MTRRVAFITGSAKGIGRRVAGEFAGSSVDLVLGYRSGKETMTEFAQHLRSRFGIQVLPLQGDVSNRNHISEMVRTAKEHFGQIDILVNNAGPYIFDRKKMVDYEFDEWEYIVNGNLNSVFYFANLFIPGMRQNRWGRIVNIGFDRAETAPGWPNRSAFAAAKVGLVSLTRTLAMEEASHGITVNMVCPGDIREEWKEADIARARQCNAAGSPVGRYPTGEDIARTILFLCGEDSDLITGSVISITGAEDVLGKA
jgi:3-oxoacyl-[acyl-carrier protein] reductase